MQSAITLRIITAILLFLSIFFMPFWATIIVALGAMIYFSFFIEAVFILFLSDLLYGVRESKLYGIIFVSSIISAGVLATIEAIKTKLKFYN